MQIELHVDFTNYKLLWVQSFPDILKVMDLGQDGGISKCVTSRYICKCEIQHIFPTPGKYEISWSALLEKNPLRSLIQFTHFILTGTISTIDIIDLRFS